MSVYTEAITEAQCLRAVADMVAILAVEMRGEGKIRWANRAAERLFGCQILGGMVGRCVDELVPDAARARHAEHRKGFAARPHSRPMGAGLDLSARRLDGTEFPAEIALIAAVVDGAECVVLTILDMSSRRGRVRAGWQEGTPEAP